LDHHAYNYELDIKELDANTRKYKEKFIFLHKKLKSMTNDLKIDLVDNQIKINSIRKSFLFQLDEQSKQLS